MVKGLFIVWSVFSVLVVSVSKKPVNCLTVFIHMLDLSNWGTNSMKAEAVSMHVPFVSLIMPTRGWRFSEGDHIF